MHGSAPWKTEEIIVGLPRLLVLSVFSRFGGCHLSPSKAVPSIALLATGLSPSFDQPLNAVRNSPGFTNLGVRVHSSSKALSERVGPVVHLFEMLDAFSGIRKAAGLFEKGYNRAGHEMACLIMCFQAFHDFQSKIRRMLSAAVES